MPKEDNKIQINKEMYEVALSNLENYYITIKHYFEEVENQLDINKPQDAFELKEMKEQLEVIYKIYETFLLASNPTQKSVEDTTIH